MSPQLLEGFRRGQLAPGYSTGLRLAGLAETEPAASKLALGPFVARLDAILDKIQTSDRLKASVRETPMRNHLVVAAFPRTRPRFVEPKSPDHAATRKLKIGAAVLAALTLFTGCQKETLFQSDFDPTPVNQPPAQTQAVGTADIHGSVVVVAPGTPPGKWVRVSRPNAQASVAVLQGNFSKFHGDGDYTATATLVIPSGSGLATIQFERFDQPVNTLTGFLHIDFTQDNRVRIDDKEDTKFGSFPRDQPFIVQVRLKISATTATASIVLSGTGATGEADYDIIPALHSMARQFGAVRVWMGFPHTGAFDATNIVVSRRED